MAKEYDLAVLGGGIGGYAAAIRASQLGMQVALVEKAELGGTCLHRGCIPTKAFLRSAEVFRQTREAGDYGIETKTTTWRFDRVQERKNNIVQTLYKGVQGLINKNQIDVFTGYGRILGPSIFSPLPGTISVEHAHDKENTMVVSKHVLIATGSRPKIVPGLDIDGTYVMTSDEALQMQNRPQSIIIVGGGVIGIEWASLLADFGVEVTIIEYSDDILPTEDRDVVREAEKQLQQRGVVFVKSAQVLPETLDKSNGVKIDVKKDDEINSYRAGKMLVCIGREANVKNIGLENTDIVVKNGYIQTNEFYQTKETHIYAVGDVIGGMQLAHAAYHEGIKAVEHIAGAEPLPIDYKTVPRCIYASPEVASVGLSEKEAKDKGFNIKTGKFPFQAVGKALVYGELTGFVKLVADQKTEDILGIHMIGPHVTDMISEAGLAKILDATPWEISQTVHPHPSLSEVIGEAAMAVDGMQIHG